MGENGESWVIGFKKREKKRMVTQGERGASNYLMAEK